MRWVKGAQPDGTETWVNVANATNVEPTETGPESFNVTFIGGEYVTLRGDMDLFMDKVNGVQR